VSDVLVDSSVWIDFFRGLKSAVTRLDKLLADDRAAVSGPILAEVTSGALTIASFGQLRTRLRSLTVLADPPDLWDRVADARFTLARQGVQAHLVDVAIAVTASVSGHSVLTRNKDFVAIARVVPLDLDVL
jgi:predicted nucleic acid-binding protein